MGLLGALVLLAIGALLGHGYFHLRKKPADYMVDDYLVDQDYIDCSSATTSKSEIATCYIDKKSAKIKRELGID